ncbi:hypothetical protein AB0E69_33905 [Kribbella sp. NPDC026611]|uniref:hypothetical protein n=1 Tax=Kribbella sp. NPDC026611 TaxID=3154911 RepID=UPI0033ED9F7D
MASEQDRHIKWWAIGAVSVAGLAITALPFILSRWVDREYGTWESLASSALTNVGTTVLVVAVVFFLERGLVGRVREVAERQAEAVVEERTRELVEANRDLSVRVDALQEQLERRVADEDSDRFARADRLSASISFDTVTDALEEANDLRALAFGDIIVPAGDDLDGPRIKVSWRPHWSNYLHVDLDPEHEDGEPRLTLQYEAVRDPDGGGDITGVVVDWSPHESPVDALQKLRDEMRRQGFGSEAKAVGTKLFENLHDAVAAALAARIDTDGAWAHGAMYEWLADGWAVTDRGLASRDHGIIESKEFPESDYQRVMRPGSNQGTQKFDRPAPDGVDPEFWQLAIKRASNIHPRSGWYAGDDTRPPAYTRSTSPKPRAE